MKLSSILQIILMLGIIVIMALFYYYFFQNNKNIVSNKKAQKEELIDDKIVNELINIEYNSSDREGNTFYINAEKATLKFDDKETNTKG